MFSKTITISPSMQAFIENSTRKNEWIDKTGKQRIETPWSVTINKNNAYLQHILASELPDLNEQEWQQILNTYAGCEMGHASIPANIARDYLDNIGATPEDLQREQLKLFDRLNNLSQTQQIAVLYFVQIFWSRDWLGMSFDKISSAIKGILRGH